MVLYPWSDRDGYLLKRGYEEHRRMEIPLLLVTIAHIGEMPKFPFNVDELIDWIEQAPVSFA